MKRCKLFLAGESRLVTSQLGTGKKKTFFYRVPPQKAKNYEKFQVIPGQGESVSNIPAGYGKNDNHFLQCIPPQKAKNDEKKSRHFLCTADDHSVGGALPAGPHTYRPDGERLHHHRRRHGAMRHRLRTIH